MAKEQLFVIGPVLSFRGQSSTEGGTWHVTALVGVRAAAEAPRFQVEGRVCAEPLLLHEDAKYKYLRYDLSCRLNEQERRVVYGVVDGPSWRFTVPGNGYAPRMAYVSCNGFSDPRGMRKLIRPMNAVWEDLVCAHDDLNHQAVPGYKVDKELLWHSNRTHAKGVQRFHVMLMGGDQVYFDSIWEDLKELKDWVGLSREAQLQFKVSAGLRKRIDEYYLGRYSERWLPESRGPWNEQRKGLDAADALASMPTMMMWDDHDIFDGWGSYTPELQQSSVFQCCFESARRAFWVFQLQHELALLPALEELDDPRLSHDDPHFRSIEWSRIQAQDALALPILEGQPGFTYGFTLGPVAVLVADLRTERSRGQVLGGASWVAMQTWLQGLPSNVESDGVTPRQGCQHLLVMSSVPVLHPKLSLAEDMFDILGQDNVLDSNADDLRDHWSHDDHEGERLRLIETLGRCARSKRLRVSLLSGDVHVAARGTVQRRGGSSSRDWDQIQQFTSSAVVHPSLSGVLEQMFLLYLNSAAKESQMLDNELEVQVMLFPNHNRYVMPARNWMAVELDLGVANRGRASLWVTWRCERPTGFGNHLHAVHAPDQLTCP